MINIEIKFPDLSPVTDMIGMFHVDQIKANIAPILIQAARDHLSSLAIKNLDTSKQAYLDALTPIQQTEKGFEFSLEGALANMVEEGWEGGLMQETHLANGKISKDGDRYIVVPFQHNAKSMMTPHLRLAKTEDAINQVNELGKLVRRRAGGIREGKRMKGHDLPKLKSHHSTSIYTGMIVKKTKEISKRGKEKNVRNYTTFRVMSEANMQGWYHPGIPAHEFFDQTVDFVEDLGPKIVENLANQLMKIK